MAGGTRTGVSQEKEADESKEREEELFITGCLLGSWSGKCWSQVVLDN